jgi:hypothetical protein
LILGIKTKKRKSMANDRKRSISKEKLGEPTFEKQIADYAVKSTDDTDPIFSGAFYNFMSGLLEKRDTAIQKDLIKEVSDLITDYNKQTKSIISELLTTQTATVGRVVGEVMVAIEGLDKKLIQVEKLNRKEHDEIMTVLSDLKTRQDNADEKIKKEELELKLLKNQIEEHDRKFEFKKKRIDGLEKEVIKREREILAKIKSIDDEIHGEVPLTVFRTYRLEKWIVFFILAIFVSTLITFFSIRAHAKHVKSAGQNGNVKIENTR